MKLIKLSVPENPSEGLELISLVDVPAHLQAWHAFADNKLQFAVEDEKRCVTGVAMMPNLPIYRNSGGREWFAVFSQKDIRAMAERFMKSQQIATSTLNHDFSKPVKAFLIESYFVDNALGLKAPAKFGNLPDGTWMVTYKIADEQIWQMVKSGEINGFSVEGAFKPIDLGEHEMEIIQALNNTLKYHAN